MKKEKSTFQSFLENFLIADGFLCCFSIILLLVIRTIFEKTLTEPILNFLYLIIFIYGTVFIITLIVYIIIKTKRRNKNKKK